MMKAIKYKIHAPTVLDFLKVYLHEVLGIEIQNRTETKKKEEAALKYNQGEHDGIDCNDEKLERFLIEKMALYLAKMSMHD